jgi:hypothetical protein
VGKVIRKSGRTRQPNEISPAIQRQADAIERRLNKDPEIQAFMQRHFGEAASKERAERGERFERNARRIDDAIAVETGQKPPPWWKNELARIEREQAMTHAIVKPPLPIKQRIVKKRPPRPRTTITKAIPPISLPLELEAKILGRSDGHPMHPLYAEVMIEAVRRRADRRPYNAGILHRWIAKARSAEPPPSTSAIRDWLKLLEDAPKE